MGQKSNTSKFALNFPEQLKTSNHKLIILVELSTVVLRFLKRQPLSSLNILESLNQNQSPARQISEGLHVLFEVF